MGDDPPSRHGCINGNNDYARVRTFENGILLADAGQAVLLVPSKESIRIEVPVEKVCFHYIFSGEDRDIFHGQ